MIVIQDPADPDSTYLLESLLDACGSANKFTGAFAFASSAGVRLVTGSDEFTEIAENYEVDLVVGIDAVTNNAALDELENASSHYPNFRVRAFLNPRGAVIFHPKFCWTRLNGTGKIITGSGNLTEGGLLKNWEAYAYNTLSSSDLIAVEKTWEDWTERHDSFLRPVDDAEVRERAGQNHHFARVGDLPVLKAGNTTEEEAETPPDLREVLVTEIPGGTNNRWGQANFKKRDFEDYFGARVDEQRLIVFRHVDRFGEPGPYYSRKNVIVKSHNFRFELDAARGIKYPAAGRPIGIFLRNGTRNFLYHLAMPQDPDYPIIVKILDDLGETATANRTIMRRARMSADDLRMRWPKAPLWNVEEI